MPIIAGPGLPELGSPLFSGGSYLGPLVFARVSCIVSALIYGPCVRTKPVRTFEESM